MRIRNVALGAGAVVALLALAGYLFIEFGAPLVVADDDSGPGVEVGNAMPPISLVDQAGTTHTTKSLLDSLGRGEVLAVVFHRSAMW